MKLSIMFIALLLAGCATPGKNEPVTQHEAAATSMGNCATAIRDIVTSINGDSTSKVVAVSSIERLCGSGAMFARAPEQSTASTVWGAVLSVADIAMRAYGIRANRDLGIAQSNNAAQTTIAGYQSFSNIAGAGFAANSAIAGKIQSPVANVTNNITNTPTTNTITGGAGPVNLGGIMTYSPVTSSYNPVTTNPPGKTCTPTYSATGVPTGFTCV